MIKYLLKATNEYFVETKEDADKLHKAIEEEATNHGWTLTGWTETYKTKKSGGEVVAEWFVCKSTIVFDDPKDPLTPLKSIDYNMMNSADIVAERAAADDGEVPW